MEKKREESLLQSKSTLYSTKPTKEMDDESCYDDHLEDQLTNIKKYEFVIGVIKPGQKRFGLIAANKKKITISGKLGIEKKK